jgi:hypothetical protein
MIVLPQVVHEAKRQGQDDFKNQYSTPPNDKIRAYRVVDLLVDSTSPAAQPGAERSGLTPRPFDLCGRDCGSGGGFGSGFAAEDGGGDESNDKADGQGLHEGVGHVDEGVLVELLRALYGSDLRGGGGGVKSGGLDLVNLRGEVAVHEVGHEVEVEDLPHGDVADGGDEGDQDAAGEGAAEGDLAGEGVVAVTADAEVD